MPGRLVTVLADVRTPDGRLVARRGQRLDRDTADRYGARYQEADGRPAGMETK